MINSNHRHQYSASVFTLMLLLASSLSARGAIFSIINKVISDDDLYRYSYSITRWDEDDATPNPCYGLTRCYVALSHRHTSSGGSGNTVTAWSAGGVPCLTRSKTIGELGQCLKTTASNITGTGYPYLSGVLLSTPYNGETVHGGNVLYPECVGLFWSTRWMDLDNAGRLLPGSVCGLAPPPSGRCAMQDAILLDHGSLVTESVAGSVAQQQISIDCGQATNGKLFLQGLADGRLPVGEDIESTISLNGTPLTNAGLFIPLKKGANPLTITSTLYATGKLIEGERTGQGILILTLN